MNIIRFIILTILVLIVMAVLAMYGLVDWYVGNYRTK
ncbi:hypothetical protein SMQC20_12190 [Serratia marcescens]|nr:hypothetical protein SMQC20_12190 [Serratia marcescens]